MALLHQQVKYLESRRPTVSNGATPDGDAVRRATVSDGAFIHEAEHPEYDTGKYVNMKAWKGVGLFVRASASSFAVCHLACEIFILNR